MQIYFSASRVNYTLLNWFNLHERSQSVIIEGKAPPALLSNLVYHMGRYTKTINDAAIIQGFLEALPLPKTGHSPPPLKKKFPAPLAQ